ncbi:hypothetical protein N7E81_07400 [Reichenbachiella carrageenanivorans]|uniref:Uncharacterized protein n=1 Tax=Reichenbachiella carrageenanivorans TaxID=2979869 RepID=A0ABY6D786_9BACT|nr:hypothetical protein [Reichenbachiella carrageenanivorans]UXX80923.1 hypothetical protein N7E81_07400 [Reichenbachiella carrageenanivorans]
MNKDWQLLTFPELSELAQTRAQFHQAIQNVAAVGRSFLPHCADDENANLEWDFDLQRLVGRWIEADIKFRSSISLQKFEVYLVDQQFQTISSIAMQDKRQTDIMVWLEHELSRLGADFSKINLAYPYTIPEYPTAKKEPFHLNSQAAATELGKLYHNTAYLLKQIVSKEENGSEIKCWPHHFDIAARVTLLDTGDPETSRSINMGMSPGDKHYNEPYFYCSPWPYPTKKLIDLNDLNAHWHQDEWVGAVLPVSQLVDHNLIQDQRRIVMKFYDTALAFLKEVL